MDNKELLDHVDAMIFSGDFLVSSENREMFAKLLIRWNIELIEMKKIFEDEDE